MFAGIWCTMRIFNDLSGAGSAKMQVQAIVNGLDDEKNIDDLMIYGGVDKYDILTYEDSVDAEQSGIVAIGSDESK